MSFVDCDIPLLASIAGINSGRRAWLCDIWGVLHNGISVFPSALAACRAFRETGGRVVLISNSPRPGPGVEAQLAELSIHADCYDDIVTSGDVTRALVTAHIGKSMYHLGPERDQGFFDGISVNFVSADKAEVLVCTGLVDDENEAPGDYAAMLKGFAARNAVMICGNPDLMVERGDRLIPCAGLLAEIYAGLGGRVIQAGKPHRPIYDLALEKIGGGVAAGDILAIGDGVDTDIKGAALLGIDAVYIASRVHLEASIGSSEFNAAAFRKLFSTREFRPIAAMPQLAW